MKHSALGTSRGGVTTRRPSSAKSSTTAAARATSTASSPRPSARTAVRTGAAPGRCVCCPGPPDRVKIGSRSGTLTTLRRDVNHSTTEAVRGTVTSLTARRSASSRVQQSSSRQTSASWRRKLVRAGILWRDTTLMLRWEHAKSFSLVVVKETKTTSCHWKIAKEDVPWTTVFPSKKNLSLNFALKERTQEKERLKFKGGIMTMKMVYVRISCMEEKKEIGIDS